MDGGYAFGTMYSRLGSEVSSMSLLACEHNAPQPQIATSITGFFKTLKRLRIDRSLRGSSPVDGFMYVGSLFSRDDDPEESILHELAHFAQIERPRMALENFGLGGETLVEGYVQRGFADVTREAQVVAIQANLHRYFGVAFHHEHTARAIAEVPGFKNFQGDLSFPGACLNLRKIIANHQRESRFEASRVLDEVIDRDAALDASPDILWPNKGLLLLGTQLLGSGNRLNLPRVLK